MNTFVTPPPNRRKAFTIVELIIVIAVIGVLAAILIPTFANVISKANAKSALSDARNTLTNYLSENVQNVNGETIGERIVIIVEKAKSFYVYGYCNGQNDNQLMQAAANPIPQTPTRATLADFITEFNLSWTTYEGYVNQLNANPPTMTPEQYDAAVANYIFAFTTSGVKASQTEIDQAYNNLKDKIKQVPAGTSVYAGMLVGNVVDVAVVNPGGGNIGGNGGGNGGGGGADPVTYTVTYAPGDADASVENMPSPGTATQNVAFTPASGENAPTWAGHRFVGWYLGAEEKSGAFMVESNITLTAHWTEIVTHTITFNPNGGAITLPLPAGFNGDANSATIVLEENSQIGGYLFGATRIAATMTNNTFGGWSATQGGTAIVDSTTVGTTDATYYAVWTETEYTVTYVLGEGLTDGNISNTTKKAAQTFDLPTPAASVHPENQRFAGWRCSYDSSLYKPQDGTVTYTMPGQNVTFTAEWVDDVYTVNFYAVDGITVVATHTGAIGAEKTSPAAPVREGYDFTCWKNGDATLNASTPYQIAGDATYTAQYTPKKYQVKFYNDVEGAEGIAQWGQTQEIAYDTAATAPASTPTKVGSEFANWNQDFSHVRGDMNIYPVWNVNSYVITLNPGEGGTFTAPEGWTLTAGKLTKSFNHGSEIVTELNTIAASNATNSNAYMVTNGWSPAVTAVTGAKEYTLQWALQNYTITLAPGEGGSISSSTADWASGEGGVLTRAFPAGTAASVWQLELADIVFTSSTHDHDSWTPTLADVTAATTYTATWTAKPSGTYYYGNAYRDADGKLCYNSTLPTTAGTKPMNIIANPASVSHTLPDGTTIIRTFTATDTQTVVGSTTYIKCTESTDWETVAPGYTVIDSLAKLNNLSGETTLGTTSALAKYILACDIGYSGATWTPAGLSQYAYSLKYCYIWFDGMGYTVDNVTISASTVGSSCCGIGFFANVNGITGKPASISNFNITNANVSVGTVSSNTSSVGIIVGAASYANITNCHVGGAVTNSKTASGCGGIIGTTKSLNINGAVNISNCSSTANVTNTYTATGGILGKGITVPTITNCWSKGIIKAAGTVGGIAGAGANCTNCWSKCNINSSANQIGGINGSAASNTITSCWYDGYLHSSVTSTTNCGNIGGIAGFGDSSTAISDCWSAGSYFGYGSAEKTGIAGIYGFNNGVVTRCISYAKLYNYGSGSSYVYPISSTKMSGNVSSYGPADSGSAKVSFYITGNYYYSARATLNSDGSFGVTSSTAVAAPMGYSNCVEVSTYSHHGFATVAELIVGISSEHVISTGSYNYSSGPWYVVTAWNLTGAYPELVNNAGHPSV